MRRQRLELYELPDYVPRKNKSNDYGFDPHEQEHETFTGMGADINVHDQWACESMGTIQDRTREHLGQSDKAITAYRRLLRQAIEDNRRRRQAADGARRERGAEHHRAGRGRRHRPDRRLAGLLAEDRRRQAQGRELGERRLTSAACPRRTSIAKLSSIATICGPPNSAAPRPRSSARSSGASSRSSALRSAISTACCAARRWWRPEAANAMRSGVTMTSTLLAKDTSHRTVFPVFGAGGGMGLDEMEGAGNFVMVADPATFRVLPWANNTGWMLCDIYFPNGKPVPFSTRALYRDALGKLAKAGFDFFAGLEVEFQLFKLVDPKLSPDSSDLAGRGAGRRAHHARLSVPHRGALRSGRSDPRNPAQDRAGARHAAAFARGRARPEPVRVHLRAADGPRGGRHHGAVSQRHEAGGAAARLSRQLHVPAETAQHASPAAGICISRCSIANRARTCSSPNDKTELLVAARPALSRGPASRMRAQRRRSPRRPSTATSAITASTRWRRSRRSGRRDNRGVMIRVLGEPGDPSTHLENRVGEPLANPYLYMASQIYAGLDGIARKLDAADRRPIALRDFGRAAAEVARRGARGARRTAPVSAPASATSFVDYHLRIKQAEIARCDAGIERTIRQCDGCHRLGASGIFRSGMIAGSRSDRCAAALETGFQNLYHFEPFLWRAITKNLVTSNTYMVNGT